MHTLNMHGVRIGTVPTIREFSDGTRVASFRVADNSDDTAIWMTVSAWNALADLVMEHAEKGMSISLAGRISKSTAYVSKDGEVAPSLDVTAEWITFGLRITSAEKPAEEMKTERKAMTQEEYRARRKNRPTD
jgi:single-stranded DNA-binding protein